MGSFPSDLTQEQKLLDEITARPKCWSECKLILGINRIFFLLIIIWTLLQSGTIMCLVLISMCSVLIISSIIIVVFYFEFLFWIKRRQIKVIVELIMWKYVGVVWIKVVGAGLDHAYSPIKMDPIYFASCIQPN